jgi:branched-chain amino acid transport system permease protein
MLMAPMGSIYAQYVLIVNPNDVFSVDISILVLLIAVLGGVGTIWGPLIGASILIPISEFTRIYFGGTGRSIDLIIYGILIILICIFRPAGIISLIPKSLRERKKV